MTSPCNPVGLDATDLTFRYAQTAVLRGVSLHLKPGEMLAVAGPNGSGKTTLLKLLSGLFRPESGRVCLDGHALSSLATAERAKRIAVVGQHVDTALAFTVREVVALGRAPYMSLLGGRSPRDRAAVDEAIESTAISSLAARSFRHLSGGEQQRVMLAMALAQEADFLLLDEPTVHLDLRHQHDLLELLVALRRRRDIGILAIMHDLNLAALYFDRLALLAGGALVADGTPVSILGSADNLAIFQTPLQVVNHPQTGTPQVLLRRDSPAP